MYFTQPKGDDEYARVSRNDIYDSDLATERKYRCLYYASSLLGFFLRNLLLGDLKE